MSALKFGHRRLFLGRSTATRAGATGVVVGLIVGLSVSLVSALVPTPAEASTSSAVTVAARSYDLNYDNAPFPDLAVTVSKTTDLVSQGILVSWTGGKKSVRPQGSVGGENFMQIAQCWGEDPLNPGHPDRTTCQYGAFPNVGRDSNVLDNVTDPNDEAFNLKSIAPEDEQYTAKGTGGLVPTYTSIPFRAVSGETVASVAPNAEGVLKHDTSIDVNTNEFFTQFTSNEIKWAGADDTGAGSVKFEVQTSMQSPGLGCGQPIIVSGRPIVGQSCWLVIIPRGTGDSGVKSITRPGLFWDAWQHHVAVKLDFKPVGIRCEIGGAEAALSGSELIGGAIASWQPSLCAGTTNSAFVLSTGNEADAAFKASKTVPSPLALTSRPLGADFLNGAADPLQYAPVGISGLSVSFAVDRRVTPIDGIKQEYKDRETQAFSSLKLTPRLVAKLLTSSYISSLPPGADLTHVNYHSFADQGKNPANLTRDRDFLAINDEEWASQDLNSTSLADLLIPSGRSDLAAALWRYVLSDPDAVAFLSGTPDPWGMIVNPWYSTSATVNPSTVGLSLPRDNFPKADPVEKAGTTGSNGEGPVNLVTWRPYTSDFENGAYLTLRGDGQLLGGWDTSYTPPKYAKTARSLVGEQGVLGLTTTASAARYQNVTASLLNPAGEYVTPTESSLTAAAAAMTPSVVQPKVVEFDPDSSAAIAASNAYPLAMPIYAALNPLQTDAVLRAKYANMIRYAVGAGQISGPEIGQLPEGYAPLPASWVSQAQTAATAIEKGISPIPAAVANVAPTSAAVAASAPRPGLVQSPVMAPETAPVVTTPAVTGDAAGPLLGLATPKDPPAGPAGLAIPAGLLSGLAAAGAVPMISRFRRRL